MINAQWTMANGQWSNEPKPATNRTLHDKADEVQY